MSGRSRLAAQPGSAMSNVSGGSNFAEAYVPMDSGPMATGCAVGDALGQARGAQSYPFGWGRLAAC